MVIEARISGGYRRKLGLIGLLFFAFGVWASYDVFVKFPPQLTRYTIYQEFQAQGHPEDWPAEAARRGWPVEEPVRRVRSDYYFNGGLMLLIPVGLWFGLTSLMAGRRWIRADQAGLSTYQGKQTAWDQIESLNDRRWASKGIALVLYKGTDGRRKKIVLDEFNYQTMPIRQIHARVQQALGLATEIPVPAQPDGNPPPAQE